MEMSNKNLDDPLLSSAVLSQSEDLEEFFFRRDLPPPNDLPSSGASSPSSEVSSAEVPNDVFSSLDIPLDSEDEEKQRVNSSEGENSSIGYSRDTVSRRFDASAPTNPTYKPVAEVQQQNDLPMHLVAGIVQGTPSQFEGMIVEDAGTVYGSSGYHSPPWNSFGNLEKAAADAIGNPTSPGALDGVVLMQSANRDPALQKVGFNDFQYVENRGGLVVNQQPPLGAIPQGYQAQNNRYQGQNQPLGGSYPSNNPQQGAIYPQQSGYSCPPHDQNENPSYPKLPNQPFPQNPASYPLQPGAQGYQPHQNIYDSAGYPSRPPLHNPYGPPSGVYQAPSGPSGQPTAPVEGHFNHFDQYGPQPEEPLVEEEPVVPQKATKGRAKRAPAKRSTATVKKTIKKEEPGASTSSGPTPPAEKKKAGRPRVHQDPKERNRLHQRNHRAKKEQVEAEKNERLRYSEAFRPSTIRILSMYFDAITVQNLIQEIDNDVEQSVHLN